MNIAEKFNNKVINLDALYIAGGRWDHMNAEWVFPDGSSGRQVDNSGNMINEDDPKMDVMTEQKTLYRFVAIEKHTVMR